MNKINYQKKLDQVIGEIGDSRPKLLLHSCCAPCSSYVLEYLSEYFQITVFYYNQQRLIREMNLDGIRVIDGGYNPEVFYRAVRGYEKEAEGGERCRKCYRLRLQETARRAAEGRFDYFTTTLTISPLNNARWLNEIGQEEGEKYGVPFLPSDFKKKGGYQRSIQLSKEYSLYRQNFCGCIFSKNESLKRQRILAEQNAAAEES